ncbi:hypothetical protein QUF72_16640 [Desulfobacterales bacterium HSG2]|nr:hypothetical protein [Desulfobacterales bacterium HSG2]
MKLEKSIKAEGNNILTDYIQETMFKATYEILPDGRLFRENSKHSGRMANTDTMETCKQELQGILEEWILIGLRMDTVERVFVSKLFAHQAN